MIKATPINLNELFQVNNKLYIITKPVVATSDCNVHGQLVLLVTPIDCE